MVIKVVPLQHLGDYIGVGIYTAASGGPHPAADGYALKEATACAEPTQEQAPGRSCSLWRGVHTVADILIGTVAQMGTHTGAVLV